MHSPSDTALVMLLDFWNTYDKRYSVGKFRVSVSGGTFLSTGGDKGAIKYMLKYTLMYLNFISSCYIGRILKKPLMTLL